MTQEINSIRCKVCHAPLSLLGNQQRAKTLACHYCGTVMDCKNEFRALYSFTHIQQPKTMLRIGMQGMIDQVMFQITGFVVYKSRETEWLHYQCYSPTHGYTHLVVMAGRCLVLRRTQYLPSTLIWLLKKGGVFQAQQGEFIIDEFHFPEVFYAAGNLTFDVKQRQRNKQCFAYDDTERCYSSIQRRQGVEYYVGESMPLVTIEKLFIDVKA